MKGFKGKSKESAYGFWDEGFLHNFCGVRQNNGMQCGQTIFFKNKPKIIAASTVAGPKECAGIVTFLASEESAYITGADIAVDGGMSL